MYPVSFPCGLLHDKNKIYFQAFFFQALLWTFHRRFDIARLEVHVHVYKYKYYLKWKWNIPTNTEGWTTIIELTHRILLAPQLPHRTLHCSLPGQLGEPCFQAHWGAPRCCKRGQDLLHRRGLLGRWRKRHCHCGCCASHSSWNGLEVKGEIWVSFLHDLETNSHFNPVTVQQIHVQYVIKRPDSPTSH